MGGGQLSIECENNFSHLICQILCDATSSNFTVPKNLSLILPNFTPLSAPALAAASGMKTAMQAIAGAAVASTVPAVFSSGTVGLLWNFISICQIVNYLLYLLVIWPENAQMVFDLFSAASLTFLPNPFQSILDDISRLGSVIVLPDVFADNGAEGLFIADSGSTVGVWGIVALFYILTKVARYVFRKSAVGRMTRLITYFYDNLEWRAVLRAMESSFLSMGLGAALQLYSVTFENWVVALSTVLAILFGYLLFFYVIACCWILYNRPKTDDPIFEKKYAHFLGIFLVGFQR